MVYLLLIASFQFWVLCIFGWVVPEEFIRRLVGHYHYHYHELEHYDWSAENTTDTAAVVGLQANQRAAQQGNVDAMLAVADTYYYGDGIPRDWSAAFRTYTAAASQGKSAQVRIDLYWQWEPSLSVHTAPLEFWQCWKEAICLSSGGQNSLLLEKQTNKRLSVWWE